MGLKTLPAVFITLHRCFKHCSFGVASCNKLLKKSAANFKTKNCMVQVQDELLMRTKAEWEKQQQAAAAAAMCYWGYGEQNHLMFSGKSEWKPPENRNPPPHNDQLNIPR
jgi:hypothetical protein